MDVSIIIVNYNTKELTNQCINSIYDNTTNISFEVIVVDNASTDGSREYFQDNNNIIYIYSNENLGFGRANNLGLSVAKGSNVLFLNSDTLLLNNAVKILSDYLNTHPKVAACGGNLLDSNFQPTFSFRRILPGIFYEVNFLLFKIPERLFYYKNRTYNYSARPINVQHISGADLMIKMDVIKHIGSFSPQFFMYYEETDLCKRILTNKYQIHSVPFAKIQHLEGGSFEHTLSISRTTMSEASRLIYYKRNFSNVYVHMSNLIYALAIKLHIFLYKIKREQIILDYYRLRYSIFKDNRL